MTDTKADDDLPAETHAIIRDGNFYPFKDAGGDFEMDELADRLKLKPVQTELLTEWLKQLEIKIWFWDAHGNRNDYRRDPPGLEICVFWHPFESCVSSANLFDLLKVPLSDGWLQLGNDEEIVALEKLKAMVEASIALHNRELPE